ncbi:MAG: selenide, water dikinase SelD [Methylobacteriaceae bacterium]|nr:selenide, water dikinase SelD [Methylobacteriaceae bacterium]
MLDRPIRLTELAHGGGCGCKLAPAILRDLLSEQPSTGVFRQLLVGAETADDAAVWQIDDNTCIIVTTDFFMPIVDDPHDFGRIAATNAISDVYAMGGRPILALAIVGMPINKLPPDVIRKILAGGAAACAEARIPVAGGHSIDAQEPIYGLAVVGLAHPANVRRNADARPGDVLILTKGLGIGIYSAAIKRSALPDGAYEEMIASTTLLNRIGQNLAADADVHAMTDVTGFGLLGHALEVARASRADISIEIKNVPLLSHAGDLAQQGMVTGASTRNWASYGDDVRLPPALPLWQRHLLTDPQTSGGLLVACAGASAERLLSDIQSVGFPSARIVGAVHAGDGHIDIR